MPRTLDDIYDRLSNLLDAINNSASRGGNRTSNSNIDSIIEDFRKKLGDLSDNLDKYNTTFERDIIANQEKNAKELDKLQKEYLERFEKFKEKNAALYDKYNKQIEDATKILNDKNSTADQKKQARKDIQDAEKHIERKNQQFENQKTSQRQRGKIDDTRRLIAEDQEDKRRFRNSKVGRNISKAEDMAGNARMYGKQMQSIGKAVGGKFGGAISKAGGGLTKFAGALGKAVPVIGWVITALQLLGDAAKAVAEADAELQDIQNERNTARTNRNIERSKIDTQSLIDQLETATANGLATFETESNYAIGQQNVENMKAIAQTQNRMSAMTEGYNTAAWNALESSYDIDAAQQKVNLQYATERGKTERANTLRNLELGGREQVREVDAKLIDQDLREKETELDKRDRDYTREHPFATTATRMAGSSTNADNVYNPGGHVYGTVESANKTSIETAAIVGGIQSTLNMGSVLPVGDLLMGSFVDSAYAKQDTLAKQKLVNERNQLNSTKALTENITSMANTIQSSSNQFEDAFADSSRTIKELLIDTQNTIKKTYAQFAQKVENWALEFDSLSRQSSASKGLTTEGQMQSYSDFMIKTIKNLPEKSGLTKDEIFQIQNAYGQGTGRSLIGNETDLTKTAAMGKYLGDNNLAVELSNSTEIFNMGMSTTMDLMYDMTKQVNKMGLDGRKYMKDMSQNLKMAQKYTFKGGVQGMMNMAKWAQNVRFDMTQLPTILEKLLDGGLEGAITQGAQLQVLGGNFAMGADPLAMMYEAIDDPESLAKRYSGMLKGMGTWNSETGQVDFKGVSGMMLRQMSKITGLSVDNLRNMASQDMKKEKMGGIISSDLNEEQRATLVNKAYWKDGQWMVNDFKGNAMGVDQIKTAADMDNLQADTHEGRVEQLLETLVSYQEQEKGTTESGMAAFAEKIIADGTLDGNQQKRHDALIDYYKTNFGENLSKVEEYMNAATTEFIKTLNEDIKTPEQAAANTLSRIENSMKEIKDDVKAIADKLRAEITNAKNDNAVMSKVVSGFGSSYNHKGSEDFVKKISRLKKTALDKYSYDDGSIDYSSLAKSDEFKKLLSEGKHDLEYHLKKNGVINDYDDKLSAQQVKELLEALDNSAFKDGVLSSNGSSMLTSASNITPINDGSVQLAKSDPKDTALFAKTGGPFDTLFNGIFAKINEVSSVLPKSLEYIMPLSRVISNFSNSKDTTNNGTIKIDTVKIELNGKLELSNSNGQNINLINEIKNNPMLLRSLSELISESINKNINGGKSTYTGGTPTPRFKGMNY